MNSHASGFTLVEVMLVVATMSILGAVAIPSIEGSTQQFSLNTSAHSVTNAIRGARAIAISTNRPVRVRFNIPSTNQISVLDVAGAAVGPVMTLAPRVTFGVFTDLEIDTSGRITPLTNCPNCVAGAAPASIAVTSSGRTKTITVSASGQIATN